MGREPRCRSGLRETSALEDKESGSEPQTIYDEPARLVVTVHGAKGMCNVGHEAGDRWEFNRCTPEGMCNSAFHTMYPVLHGLMMTSARYEGPAADGTLVSCPDDGRVTFRIQRHLWTPAAWETESLS